MRSYSFKGKVMSSLLIFSLGVSLLTGCSENKNTHEIDEIPQDAPWYSSNRIVLDKADYPNPALSVFIDSFCVGKDGVATAYGGSKPIPSDLKAAAENSRDLDIEYLDYRGRDGNILFSIDLPEFYEERNLDKYRISFRELREENGDIYADFSYTDNGIKIMSAKLDVENKTLGEISDTGMSGSGEDIYEIRDFEGLIPEGTTLRKLYYTDPVRLGNKEILLAELFKKDQIMSPTDECIAIREPDGNSCILLKDALKDFGIDIKDSSVSVLLKDAETAVLQIISSDRDMLYLELDLKSKELTDKTEDYNNIVYEGSYYGFDMAQYFEGTGSVFTTTDEIKRIDFDSNAMETLVDFDYADINRQEAEASKVIKITDDEVILSSVRAYSGEKIYADGIYTPVSANDDSGQSIIFLKKCDTNPNAGKKIIRAQFPVVFDYHMAETVRLFNLQSSDWYIIPEKGFIDTDIEMDVSTGSSYDLLFNISGNGTFENSDYLLDLSELCPSENAFSVFEGAKINGKLYCMPLTFSLGGIVVKDADVPADMKGFTPELYEEYVKGPCNGVDPMFSDKETMLEFFLSAMKDTSVDGPEFATVAEFLNDKVISSESMARVIFTNGSDENGSKVEYFPTNYTAFSFMSYMRRFDHDLESLRIVGFPSVDGCGPTVYIDNSVSVVADSPCAEGCLEYVRFALSEECQEVMAAGLYGKNPVLRSVYEKAAKDQIDRFNSELDDTMVRRREKVSYDMADKYEAMIDSCNQNPKLSTEEIMTIKDEMAVYFGGQKSLDDVIVILSDKINTIRNER